MSENALTTLDNLPVSEHVDTFFNEYSKGGFNFLPRLQLCGSATKLAKEGKIPINHYALVHSADSFDDLTKAVIILPLSLRLKALDTSGDAPMSYYNPNLPEWKRIYEMSSTADSGCMAGPEFLIWLPEQKRFATFFLSAPTARPEAANIKTRLGLACQMESRMAKNKKGQTWALPVSKPYSSPIDMPPEQELASNLQKFLAEKDSVAELASDEGRER